MKFSRRGFQLTELAVVLTIIGILILFSISSIPTLLLKNNITNNRRNLKISEELLLNYVSENKVLPENFKELVLKKSEIFFKELQEYSSINLTSNRSDIDIFKLDTTSLCSALMDFSKFHSKDINFHGSTKSSAYALKIVFILKNQAYEQPVYATTLIKHLGCNLPHSDSIKSQSIFLTQTLPPITIPNSFFFRIISNSRSYNNTNYAANIRIDPPDNNHDDIALCISRVRLMERFGAKDDTYFNQPNPYYNIDSPQGIVKSKDLSYTITAGTTKDNVDFGFNSLMCPADPNTNVNAIVNGLFNGNKPLPNYGLSKNSNFKLYTLYTMNSSDASKSNFIGYPYKFYPFFGTNLFGAASFNFEIEIVAVSREKKDIIERKHYILPIATASQYEQGVYMR